jgi:hypothetical protein
MHSYPNNRPLSQEIRNLTLVHADGRKVATEAALRAAILKAIADQDTSVQSICGPFGSIEWYANNVPYHVAGKNIDILIYHRAEQFSTALAISPRVQYSVIELKRENATPEDLQQLISYCLWAGSQLAEGEIYMIKPVLVAKGFQPKVLEAISHYRLGFKPISLIQYKLTGGRLTFDTVPWQ